MKLMKYGQVPGLITGLALLLFDHKLALSGEVASRPGLTTVVEAVGFEPKVLTLSNSWVHGTSSISEEEFWSQQGFTKTPLIFGIPGGSQYELYIFNSQIMPFVGRRGAVSKPNAIWYVPDLPVKLSGLERKAKLSDCNLIGFRDGKLSMRGSSSRAILWKIWSERDGTLHIDLQEEPGW
jgi:hypothetical protein